MDEPRVVSRDELLSAYRDFLGAPTGQVVLADLVRNFGFTKRSTFFAYDTNRTAFNEGQRSVLIHIGRMLDGDLVAQFDQSER